MNVKDGDKKQDWTFPVSILVQLSVATIFLVIFGVALFELYVAWRETPGHLAAVAHRSYRNRRSYGRAALPLDAVEPASEIVKRFRTGPRSTFETSDVRGGRLLNLLYIYWGLPKSWELSG